MYTKYYNRYSYADLLAQATSEAAQQVDIDTLGAWCADYGTGMWNGECYDASKPGEPSGTRCLYPVYDIDGDDISIVRYELR